MSRSVPRLAPPWRGTVPADGVVLDPPQIGLTEAVYRALSLWQSGTRLLELPDGRWVMLLPTAVPLRCERGPGLPLVQTAGGVAAAGMTPPPGGLLRLPAPGGGVTEVRLSDLRSVPTDGWVRLDGLRRLMLEPLEAEPPRPEPIEQVTPPEPDLRSAAQVHARSVQAQRAVADLQAAAERAAHGRAGRARPSGAARPPSAARVALGRLLMRTPAVPLVRGRHAAYLRRLTEAFERRDYDTALRDAIGLASGAGGFASLRLPRRRSDLRLTMTPSGGGPNVDYGPTIQHHLRQMYQQAADELERAGRVDEAAFVLADLLGGHLGAVQLLERHGRLRLAAELAEAHELGAELVVRLHWRAGNRARALAVARSRGAYPAAIERLQQVDPAATHELRAAWVDDLRAAGSLRAAVEAAWPDEALRARSVPDIQAGMALGGPDAAALLARLLALMPSPEAADAALALLGSAEPALSSARAEFAAVCSEVRAADAVADRTLATEACRMLSETDRVPPWSRRDLQRRRAALADRADPVLRADLLADRWVEPAAREARGRMPHSPGEVPVLDAVTLRSGVILVALGDAGVRLLGSDGRTHARWDLPTHTVIAADNGVGALLGRTDGTGTWELSRLDLRDRRVRHWVTSRFTMLPTSYDGLVLHAVDPDGRLVAVDACADRPRVLTRLTPEAVVLDVARDEGQMAAVVQVDLPHGPQLERWVWDTATALLRRRAPVTEPMGAYAVTADGHVLGVVEEDVDGHVVRHLTVLAPEQMRARRVEVPEGQDARWLSAGARRAVLWTGPDSARLTLDGVAAQVDWPPGEQPTAGARCTSDRLTVWDDYGRVVVLDLAGGLVHAAFVTRR